MQCTLQAKLCSQWHGACSECCVWHQDRLWNRWWWFRCRLLFVHLFASRACKHDMGTLSCINVETLKRAPIPPFHAVDILIITYRVSWKFVNKHPTSRHIFVFIHPHSECSLLCVYLHPCVVICFHLHSSTCISMCLRATACVCLHEMKQTPGCERQKMGRVTDWYC